MIALLGNRGCTVRLYPEQDSSAVDVKGSAYHSAIVTPGYVLQVTRIFKVSGVRCIDEALHQSAVAVAMNPIDHPIKARVVVSYDVRSSFSVSLSARSRRQDQDSAEGTTDNAGRDNYKSHACRVLIVGIVGAAAKNVPGFIYRYLAANLASADRIPYAALVGFAEDGDRPVLPRSSRTTSSFFSSVEHFLGKGDVAGSNGRTGAIELPRPIHSMRRVLSQLAKDIVDVAKRAGALAPVKRAIMTLPRSPHSIRALSACEVQNVPFGPCVGLRRNIGNR